MEISNYQFALARLSYHASALHVLLAGRRIQRLLRKANFNPNEPRVPAGNPDGGQWTTIGGGSYRLPSGARVMRVDDGPHVFRLRPGMLEEDENFPGFEDFPDIPIERPGNLSNRYSIIRRIPMAPFVGKPRETLSRRLEKAGAPEWLREYYPHIDAYTEGPKSLSELKAGVRANRPGYDIHHIVEKSSALEDGLPRSLVNGLDNLVSIPRFKHWEITGWYQSKNTEFGNVSPRHFLEGQNWQARRLVGLRSLMHFGVLKNDK